MKIKFRTLLLFLLCTISTSLLATSIQVRTFDPATHKFYAGLGQNPWGFTDAICGIQLPSNADCWGNFVAYVRETTPGGKMICSSLLAARSLSMSVAYHLDVTNSGQCEIVKVGM